MKKKNKIRNGFLLIHRWLGLISGLVVFIVSMTGCLYVFEEEWREIFQYKYLYVENSEGNRKSISDLSKIVRQAYPDDQITSIRFFEEKNSAFVFWTKDLKTISINPYTGTVIGHRNMKADFMSVVLEIHLHLFMGRIGAQIVRWNVLIFFIMCISGLILWWPKQKRFLKQAVTIKWKTSNWKRMNWGLHSVLGFYALFVLLIISLTGIFWVFDSAKKIVTFATQSSEWKAPNVQSRYSGLTKENPLDSAYYSAVIANPGARQVFITIPPDTVAPIRVLLRYPYTIVRKQTTVWFDQYSVAKLHTDSYKNYSRYEHVSRSMYDFHTGRIRALGIGSKIIYFLASLFAASLPITGFLIWYGRKKKATRRTVIPAKPRENFELQDA